MTVMKTLMAIKGSVIAGVAVAVLGLLSMGLLGLALYYLTYPAHYLLLGHIDGWEGTDLFWPTIIWTGMLWSACFPAAGVIDGRLQRAGAGTVPRVLAYLAVLWLGAALIWILVPLASGYRFPASGFM